MMARVLVVVSVALLLARASFAQPGQTRAPFRVTIVGSGGGPQVNAERFGPAILVEAGEEILLFDCGRGATIRLTQLGMPLTGVNKVFLTHLHSDHVIGLQDLYLTVWGAPPGGVRRLIIHEAMDPETLRNAMADTMPAAALETMLDTIVAHHTLPEEAGEVFARVEPRLAVFAHATYSPNLLARARQTYSGPLESGEDLMTIEIGDKVTVSAFGR